MEVLLVKLAWGAMIEPNQALCRLILSASTKFQIKCGHITGSLKTPVKFP